MDNIYKTNIYKMLNLIQYAKTRCIGPSVILSLDIKKAFDQVEVPYLFALLDFMRIVQMFQRALRAIYHQPTACVCVNGATSSLFSVSRGTRQGCPLSPLLFALALEPLAEALRQAPAFMGFIVGDVHIKLSLFADDMALYVTNPNTFLEAINSILDSFAAVSGLRVNKEKSLLYPILVQEAEEPDLRKTVPYM